MSSNSSDASCQDVHSPAIQAAIEQAIAFLGRVQLPHGEFQTMLSWTPDMADAVYDASPFTTTFVLHALSFASSSSVKPMQQSALRFIASEMQAGGLWRYFSPRQFKHCRIPPDLDDTACSSFALKTYGWHTPRNTWIFRACRDDRGRFLTWVLPKPTASRLSALRMLLGLVDWQSERARRKTERPVVASHPYLLVTDHDEVQADEVDPVVNANVVLYLGENSNTSAAIFWILDEIKAHRNISPYYHDMLAFYYMVARAHAFASPTLGQARLPIIKGMERLKRSDGTFGSALSTALAACTLLTLASGVTELERQIQAVLAAQHSDGGWSSEPFYSVSVANMHWGSRELTTAFCLEALLRFQSANTPGGPPREPRQADS